MASSTEIAQCLAGTLSADPNTRMSAELNLGNFLSLPDTGLTLSQLLVSQDVDISLRQSAGIVLRKYVRERWSPHFQSFKGSAPPVEVKSHIREAVFQGLSDSNSKIRSSSAHTLSSIANCDWPDHYPELLSSLITLLSSNSPASVHGAMQVFVEFVKSDLTEDQILPVLRQLLPVLLSILGSTEHAPLTRARTVAVFRECVAALYMVKEQYPEASKEAANTVLPVWIDGFRVLLNMDLQKDVEGPNWDGLSIRIEVFKTLETIHKSFPRTLTPYLNDLLTASLSHLHALFPTFHTYYLSASTSPPLSSEGDSIEIPQLASPIMDFIVAVSMSGKAKQWFDVANLTGLVAIVLDWVQMTSDDEDSWASNANAFVAQEDDDLQSYSLRIAGLDLLACLIERSPAQTTATFQTTVQRVVSDSSQAREAGRQDWWRPLEAALTGLGSQADAVLKCIDDEQSSGRPKPIDVESLLSNVIPSLLPLSECPFLQGRSFVFASQYAKLLPAQLAGQYINAAIEVVEASQAGIPIKVSAVKAIQNFCHELDDSAVTPLAPRIAQDLGPFLLVTSEDTLSLVLDTLSVVLEMDDCKWMTPDLAGSLVLAILDVWAKNNKDPIILSILTDILATLSSASGPGVYETVVKQTLPRLCEAIGAAKSDEYWVAGSAIELVSSLVRGAPEGQLGDGFFATLGPSLFNCLRVAEDRDVLQNGVMCLTLVIRKDCAQLMSWTDSNGQSGLTSVLGVVGKLLNNEDESGGLVIGDLIIHLLRRAGNAVLPVLPELLQAMVVRMLTAKTATFLQSLVIPFAFLIHTQRDTVLSLLESTNIQGRSGLDILIQTWCENAETFQGFWPGRISNLALCQLYVSGRPSLQNLLVKGDIIVKPETKDVIVTRSRAKQTPHEFTFIPFPVKAIKLLLHDLQLSGDSATISAHGDMGEVDDAESDEGDNEWADEEQLYQGFKQEEFKFLSDLLGPRGVPFDNDDILNDNDDEDLKDDPVSQMDMRGHLMTFFRECAAQNVGDFSEVVSQLSVEEMLVVQRVVQQK